MKMGRLIDADALWMDVIHSMDYCEDILEIIERQPTCDQTATDTISRQAAIDAVMAEGRNVDSRYLESERIVHESDAVEAIAMLPSAQSEIIRCKDCKHHWIHRCMDSMPTEICDLDQTFYDAYVDFCSLAERRTDEQTIPE